MASKNRRKKTKFKLTKELVILVVGLLALIVVTIILAIPSSEKKFYNKLNNAISEVGGSNATAIPLENVFEEIDESDYSDTINEVKNAKSASGYTYFFYGSLSDSTYVSQLSPINKTAQDYEVKKVYLFYSTFYDDAKSNDELNTSSFKSTADGYNKSLNDGKSGDAFAIDFKIEGAALFVFKDGSLIFNTQVDEDSKASWDFYIQKAFGFEQIEKNNNK